jgi:hypothetical protein
MVLPLGEAHAHAVGGELPARLVGVEEGALQFRRDPRREKTNGRRAHKSRARPPFRKQPLNVIAGHQDVGVGHHHPIVGGRAPALGDVVEFRIAVDDFAADEQPRVNMRMFAEQAADERYHRIVAVGDAKENLVVRIVEMETRGERFVDVILEAADGAEDRHRRHVLERPLAAPSLPEAGRDEDGASEVQPDRQKKK